VLEVLRGLGYEGGYDTVRRYALGVAARAGGDIGGRLHSAQLCPR
jgi:hypothetical protein